MRTCHQCSELDFNLRARLESVVKFLPEQTFDDNFQPYLLHAKAFQCRIIHRNTVQERRSTVHLCALQRFFYCPSGRHQQHRWPDIACTFLVTISVSSCNSMTDKMICVLCDLVSATSKARPISLRVCVFVCAHASTCVVKTDHQTTFSHSLVIINPFK